MAINWFPGHMVAAVKSATKAMADNDVVIEVLDARCPLASTNQGITTMRALRQRPSLKVLSKADLADPVRTSAWLDFFNAQANTRAIAISSKLPGDSTKVITAAKLLAPHRDSPLKPLRMLIMGFPNVGKSTLINALLKKRRAKVGDEPAVTKLLHRYDISSSLIITDTPGITTPNIDNPDHGLMLAACHTIGVKAYDEIDVACFLAELLERHYIGQLDQRYALAWPASPSNHPIDKTGDAFLAQIARKRSYWARPGQEDYLRAANALLTDFRQGKIARFTLEVAPLPLSTSTE